MNLQNNTILQRQNEIIELNQKNYTGIELDAFNDLQELKSISIWNSSIYKLQSNTFYNLLNLEYYLSILLFLHSSSTIV